MRLRLWRLGWCSLVRRKGHTEKHEMVRIANVIPNSRWTLSKLKQMPRSVLLNSDHCSTQYTLFSVEMNMCLSNFESSQSRQESNGKSLDNTHNTAKLASSHPLHTTTLIKHIKSLTPQQALTVAHNATRTTTCTTKAFPSTSPVHASPHHVAPTTTSPSKETSLATSCASASPTSRHNTGDRPQG